MSAVFLERESKSLEFKSKLPNFHNLIKTCVAFANGVGGKLVIGVDDKTKEVIGVDETSRDRIYDEFPNSVYDATSPSLLVEVYEKNFGNVSVVVVEVPASIKKPVFIKSEGMPQGVYLRAGSSTRRASTDSIEELMRENKRSFFDEEAIPAEESILSQDLLHSIFGGKFNTARLVAEKILTQTGVNAKKYYPTVAGVLTFCDAPHQYIPEALLHCTRFQGVDDRDIIQTEEIQGCLEKQIADSFQLLRSWLVRDYQLIGARLQGRTLLPEVALRESIANALLHKRYSIPGAVKIALYDDRLEIFNPGNFPGLVDVGNLGDGTTYLRNPNLVRIARRFGVVEKLGTGIRLILESCRKLGVKKPEFIEGADSVKVIFRFLPEDAEFSEEQDSLLALFAMRDSVKIEDVQNYLSVSRNTATRRLNQLLKSEKIKRIGKGPAVRYIRSN